jgi:NADH-quinone oxidoreductase subunit D
MAAMDALIDSEGAVQRLSGVGVATAELVEKFAMSGVVARSCGIARDVRRDNPYLAYGSFGEELTIPTRDAGDALARLQLLLDEQRQSLTLIRAVCRDLSQCPGSVNVQLPKVVRLPEGSIYSETENALGVNGYWLVSRGDKMPHRLKIRSASFNNVSALGEVLCGMKLVNVVPTLATWFFISGDIDR